MRFCSLLRPQPHYRSDAFAAGLRAIGGVETDPRRCDVLVVWNRYSDFDRRAAEVESRGGVVLVCENPYLPLAGVPWYAISRSQHNGAGQWPQGPSDRWDSLGIEMAPWRESGREVVILPQRGIGPMGVAMPGHWTREAVQKLARLRRLPVRIREHPGVNACTPLADDLAEAHAVVTWGSGAAIKALAMGVPVFADFNRWIGMPAARPLSAWSAGPLRSEEARLAMFRRLIWAQWRLTEIQSGEAFRCLLS